MIGDSPESAAAAAANTGDVEVAVDAVLTAAGSPVQQASVKAARMKSKTARRLSNAQQVNRYLSSHLCTVLFASRIWLRDIRYIEFKSNEQINSCRKMSSLTMTVRRASMTRPKT